MNKLKDIVDIEFNIYTIIKNLLPAYLRSLVLI